MQDKLIFHYPRVHLNNRAWPLLFLSNCSAAATDVLSAVNASFRAVSVFGGIPTPWGVNSELNLLSSIPGTGVQKIK